jgi:hypothetical protein
MKLVSIIRWILAIVAILILITTQLKIIPAFANYFVPVLLILVLVINRFSKT